MMDIKSIEKHFIQSVSEKIKIVPDGIDRFRVFTPFAFDDGDHVSIVLKKECAEWILSDEGHTYMHLTYDIQESKLKEGQCNQIISNALHAFNVKNMHGELVLVVKDNRFGDALYSFGQAIIRMSDVLCLKTNRIQSTFIIDFRSLIGQVIPENRREFDWYDKESDPNKNYTVDCRINRLDKPIFVYALHNKDRIQDATIKIQQLRQRDIPFTPVGIFEDKEKYHTKSCSRFDDLSIDQFSNMELNKHEIIDYLRINCL